MFGSEKAYVTIENKEQQQQTSFASVPDVNDFGSTVAFDLGVILAGTSSKVLVVGYGNAMKATVRNCVQALTGSENGAPRIDTKTQIFVTGTKDKIRGFSCSNSAWVQSLGKTFDERLFTNVYAVTNAALECGAQALLIPDVSFAKNKLLGRIASENNFRLFVPMDEKIGQVWLEVSLPNPADMVGVWKHPIEWRACPKCKLQHEINSCLEDFGYCPTCGELYRLNSDERISLTFDKGTFEEWFAGMPQNDPLAFPDYDGLIARNAKKSGLEEAVRCGKAKLAGIEVAFCIMEASFMMGSMGTVVGEKVTRTAERATELGLPLIIFTASGGARMQEGLVSLMQMAKTSAAIERHGRAKLPYISVITDPTTGGVTASFAMEGDVIISEPHALIGFAGQRVIQDTIRQTLPEGFQTAEFALEHGLIDAIVPRENLRSYLAHILAIHLATVGDVQKAVDASSLSYEAVEAALATGSISDEYMIRPHNPAISKKAAASQSFPANVLGGLRKSLKLVSKASGKLVDDLVDDVTLISEGADLNSERDPQAREERRIKKIMSEKSVADAPKVRIMTEKEKDASENAAWESVLLARNIHRPTSQYYINEIIDGFIELHGDRSFGDDGAILAGIGWLNGVPVTVLAEEKGADLKQRIARNFGCPQPEGYRKSLRLAKAAEKFGRPIICLVDTQGAFCGTTAEERGVGNAIADNLTYFSGIDVPVVSCVLGEGGSGGALALAVGNRVAMQEHAVYSVLSPEGFASILWKDRSRAAEAAAVMKMSAAEAKELGLIEEVLSEGNAPAHENPDVAAREVKRYFSQALSDLLPLSAEELREQRYNRFRAM